MTESHGVTESRRVTESRSHNSAVSRSCHKVPFSATNAEMRRDVETDNGFCLVGGSAPVTPCGDRRGAAVRSSGEEQP